MSLKLIAALISLAAILSFVAAIASPERRSTFVILGAGLMILASFVMRAARK
jgi:hypothetical protein